MSVSSRSFTTAGLASPPASSRAWAASSRVQPVLCITMCSARHTSFWLVWRTSTIRFWYTFPTPTMLAVEIMFRIIFWAVPAFRRVEPESTSGPVYTSTAASARADARAPRLQEMAAVRQPASRARRNAPST